MQVRSLLFSGLFVVSLVGCSEPESRSVVTDSDADAVAEYKAMLAEQETVSEEPEVEGE
ncbi:MAG: hypothetical protein AAGJ40_18315 [Planctomycetota bacterium]